jgi:hypothetical protein
MFDLIINHVYLLFVLSINRSAGFSYLRGLGKRVRKNEFNNSIKNYMSFVGKPVGK